MVLEIFNKLLKGFQGFNQSLDKKEIFSRFIFSINNRGEKHLL